MTPQIPIHPSNTLAILRSGGRRMWVMCAAVAVLLSATEVQAHGPSPHEHPEATQDDTRQTPRTADQHETGTLPRSRGESTTAESKVRFEARGEYGYIVSNGIPNHETGRFPNRGNPNVMAEQSYTFRIPLNPPPPEHPVLTASDITSDRGFLFGIALNGVVFEPATGLNWTPEGQRRGGRPAGWVYEAVGGSIDFGIDHANAHIQRTGAYHYHGIPVPLMLEDRPTLLGYAADGYPIYGPLGYKDPADATSPLVNLESSWRLKQVDRPSPPDGPGGTPDGRFTADWEFVPNSGDLDRLNGRFAVTPEHPDGVYHYVLISSFPHVPRGFAGTPDSSFHRMPGQGPNHVDERGERLPIGAGAGEPSDTQRMIPMNDSRPPRRRPKDTSR